MHIAILKQDPKYWAEEWQEFSDTENKTLASTSELLEDYQAQGSVQLFWLPVRGDPWMEVPETEGQRGNILISAGQGAASGWAGSEQEGKEVLLTQFWIPEPVAPAEKPCCSLPGNCYQSRKNMFNAMALLYDWIVRFLSPKWRVVTESSFPDYCSNNSNKTPETPLKKGTLLLWLRPGALNLFMPVLRLYVDFMLSFKLINITQGKK